MSAEETHVRILKLLAQQPDITQRELADALGVSLGKTHYLLRGLLDKGLVKARNFRNSRNRLGYLYQLTPAGIEHKARVTLDYLQRRLAEYEQLKAELEALQREMGDAGMVNAATGRSSASGEQGG